MGAPDIVAWRKNNSDPLTVDMVLTDGTELRAVVMVARGKTLDFVFNVEQPFIEVDCLENGPTVFAVNAIRSVRPAQLPKADQLDKRLAALEKIGNFALLKVTKTATRLEVAEAYHATKAPYDLDEATMEPMPPEVRAYFQAMNRRIDQAALEILATLPEAAAKDEAQAA
jgi:hypothetical protein